jgi:rfaE bifunctional protein kinase chain/domain
MTPVEILERIAGVKTLVVGDVMLDRAIAGESFRQSPEADVPVILNPTVTDTLGGAGAVAAMCAALGSKVTLVGVVGDDSESLAIVGALSKTGVDRRLARETDRPTTIKERIWVQGSPLRQVARIDRENASPLDPLTEVQVKRFIPPLACTAKAILISDYAKGVCSHGVVHAAMRGNRAKVIVDPPRGQDWGRYDGVACLVPNHIEAGEQITRQIRQQHNLEAAIIKVGHAGCMLSAHDTEREKLGNWHLMPRKSQQLDPCGAGDQFLAALGCARAVGATWLESAAFANIAAGMQVERYGCVPVTHGELLAELTQADVEGATDSLALAASHPH